MHIPKRIKSQGLWWTVRFSPDIENLGQTDYDKMEIIISSNIPRGLQESTFFHELGHTINTTIDHPLMDSISTQYFQIIKDNRGNIIISTSSIWDLMGSMFSKDIQLNIQNEE